MIQSTYAAHGSLPERRSAMSKPAKSPRQSSSLLKRWFSSRHGREGTPTRGRQKTPIKTLTPRRCVRILFFSTWGSDYRQYDLSAKSFGSLLCGFILVIGLLAVGTTYAVNYFVQKYRLAAFTEEHQILLSHLNQTETRARNLIRRLDGEDEDEASGLTHNSETEELPAFVNPPEDDGTATTMANRPASASGAKRGPLGLAWTDNAAAVNELNDKEQNFFGQGGGAFVDDEDNIHPSPPRASAFNHAREKVAAASLTPELNMAAESESNSGNDLLAQLEKNLSKTQALQRTIMQKFEVRRKQLEHIPSIKPLLNGRITDFFGKRVDPFVSRTRHHQGLDIGAPNGTEVFAPANGVIEFVKTAYRRNSGYGRAVVINHGYGVKTLYGHLSAIKVKPGQKIERWDLIGLVGETGRATGPHLHYEVWVDGETCDPLRFILNN
jgi:murein DD-endopeptidase MepM/ murein hydrolase activator NlpD